MKKIAVVGDFHCGSIFGMLPAKFETSEGVIKPQNAGQRYLWECWQHACDYIVKQKVDAIVVNGDVIDGMQRAQRGTELSLVLTTDQRAAAVETLLPLASLAPMYFVQGTEYHDLKAGQAVEEVAKTLNAVRYDGPGTGRYSREVLDLEVDDVVLNFSHGIGVGSGFYRATPYDREGIFSALAGKDGKMPKADVVVRSHAHFFLHLEHASKHMVGVPCWQLQTRFMRKNSVYRMLPDIGFVILHIDGDAKREGFDPCVVQKVLYSLPRVNTVKLQDRQVISGTR